MTILRDVQNQPKRCRVRYDAEHVVLNALILKLGLPNPYRKRMEKANAIIHAAAQVVKEYARLVRVHHRTHHTGKWTRCSEETCVNARYSLDRWRLDTHSHQERYRRETRRLEARRVRELDANEAR